MSHIAFKRFRPSGLESVPAAEAFLRRLEAWLEDAGLHNVGIAMDVQCHGKDGAQVIGIDLATGFPGTAAVSIAVCIWPDSEVEYYLTVHDDRDILTSSMEERIDADRALAICEAVAIGQLTGWQLTLAGRTIGQRAALRYGRSGTWSQASGIAGLGLDRIAAALGLARLQETAYRAWKAF